jgi:hypothetical protein
MPGSQPSEGKSPLIQEISSTEAKQVSQKAEKQQSALL